MKKKNTKENDKYKRNQINIIKFSQKLMYFQTI